MSEQQFAGEVNKTDLGECTPQYHEKEGNHNTRTVSTNCLPRVQEGCTRRRQMLKALVYYCFLVFRRVGEYIFLGLLYFVNLIRAVLKNIFTKMMTKKLFVCLSIVLVAK